MENDALTAGEVIPTSSLPAEFQPAPVELQQIAEDTGHTAEELTPVTVVPTENDVVEIETQIFDTVVAIEHLDKMLASIENVQSLSPQAATALTVSLERYKVKVFLPTKEAFATGNVSITTYAREAMQAERQSLVKRVLGFFAKWARITMLWIQSIVTQRGQANTALDYVNKAMADIKTIKISPRGFSGARWLFQSESITSNAQLEEAARVVSFDIGTLDRQMRDLLDSSSKMFGTVPDSAENVLKSAQAVQEMASYVKANPEFNKNAIGGLGWAISVTDDASPSFSVDRLEADSYSSAAFEGQLSKAAFQTIARSAKNAMTQSQSVVSTLHNYSKTVARAIGQSAGSDASDQVSTENIKSLFTAATTLRVAASYYDRVVCSVALDCGRAAKFANRP